LIVLLAAAPIWLLTDPLDGFQLKAKTIANDASQAINRLMVSPLYNFFLKQDDFVYLAESRTAPALVANLARPHNAHVVPLFRVWTFVLIQVAGSLEHLPAVFGLGSYAPLVLMLLATGHLVAWETRNPAAGLAAMAALGLSTVLALTVTWYAASQVLWAGLMIVLMLVGLQSWRARGSAGRLALALLAAAAAPLFWSVGFVAGPVGLAYLWADGRPRCRRAALLPVLISALVALAVWAVAGRQIDASDTFNDRPLSAALNPIHGVVYTTQAIIEVLVLRNLGLDLAATATQGVVLVLALAGLWAWSRGVPVRPNPLEAAGAVLAVLSFLVVFTARGYLPFESVRALGWYQAVPQIGAVLFGIGWWAGRLSAPSPASLKPPSRRELLAVLGLAAALIALQTPRVRARVLQDAPPVTAWEQIRFPIPLLERLRAAYFTAERAGRQRRFLARIERAEQVCGRLGIGRAAIRRAFGRVLGPGMPEHLERFDAVDLLAIPELGPETDPMRIRSALRDLLAREPEPRPSWIPAQEPWPPS
jgi:hypothetical protein